MHLQAVSGALAAFWMFSSSGRNGYLTLSWFCAFAHIERIEQSLVIVIVSFNLERLNETAPKEGSGL